MQVRITRVLRQFSREKQCQRMTKSPKIRVESDFVMGISSYNFLTEGGRICIITGWNRRLELEKNYFHS
jgi:hypothetical protein